MGLYVTCSGFMLQFNVCPEPLFFFLVGVKGQIYHVVLMLTSFGFRLVC